MNIQDIAPEDYKEICNTYLFKENLKLAGIRKSLDLSLYTINLYRKENIL